MVAGSQLYYVLPSITCRGDNCSNIITSVNVGKALTFADYDNTIGQFKFSPKSSDIGIFQFKIILEATSN